MRKKTPKIGNFFLSIAWKGLSTVGKTATVDNCQGCDFSSNQLISSFFQIFVSYKLIGNQLIILLLLPFGICSISYLILLSTSTVDTSTSNRTCSTTYLGTDPVLKQLVVQVGKNERDNLIFPNPLILIFTSLRVSSGLSRERSNLAQILSCLKSATIYKSIGNR